MFSNGLSSGAAGTPDYPAVVTYSGRAGVPDQERSLLARPLTVAARWPG